MMLDDETIEALAPIKQELLSAINPVVVGLRSFWVAYSDMHNANLARSGITVAPVIISSGLAGQPIGLLLALTYAS